MAELIAELKWAISGVPPRPEGAAPGVLQFGFFNSSASEEFYMRFGALAHQQGFTVAERIFPPGFPSPPFQVVYRYKGATPGKEILQVGPGVFSANALRPYQSWHTFRPSVAAGIDWLLAARADSEKQTAFTAVGLRYINSFTSDLTGGRDAATFVRDVLGIQSILPEVITKQIPAGVLPIPNLTFGFPTVSGLRMQISVSDAIVEGGQSIVLDMGVQSAEPVASNADALLAVLDTARNILHETFVELTKPISDAMQPEGSDV